MRLRLAGGLRPPALARQVLLVEYPVPRDRAAVVGAEGPPVVRAFRDLGVDQQMVGRRAGALPAEGVCFSALPVRSLGAWPWGLPGARGFWRVRDAPWHFSASARAVAPEAYSALGALARRQRLGGRRRLWSVLHRVDGCRAWTVRVWPYTRIAAPVSVRVRLTAVGGPGPGGWERGLGRNSGAPAGFAKSMSALPRGKASLSVRLCIVAHVCNSSVRFVIPLGLICAWRICIAGRRSGFVAYTVTVHSSALVLCS